MTRHAKLCVVLLALGLGGYGFCADYTQHEDFGVKKPGDVVSFTVTPPGTVLTGGVDSPGGFIWVGGPASWTGTIPPDFAGVHNGSFSGTYQPPPGGGTGGPPHVYTWEADTAAEVVKLETITDATIPSDRTRRKLGVGEKDTLTLVGASGPVTWSLSGPGQISSTSGNPIRFTAHERASGASVTATYKGKTYPGNFSVVEPASESAIKQSEDNYPAGTQGAGMWLEITISPTDVSFERVESQEVPGPATDITGYFITHTPPAHVTAGWVGIAPGNIKHDHAAFSGWPSPWSAGGFRWVIPIQWRVLGSANVGTLPNRIQTFSIADTNGTSTVTKLGQSVTRSP